MAETNTPLTVFDHYVNKNRKVDWEKFGLLEGLDTTEKKLLSKLFDFAMDRIYESTSETLRYSHVDMLPILRRILTENKDLISEKVSTLRTEKEEKFNHLKMVNGFLNTDLPFDSNRADDDFYKGLVLMVFRDYFKFILDDAVEKYVETPETLKDGIDVEAENLSLFCDLFGEKLKERWTTKLN